jgi:hypothetical protein
MKTSIRPALLALVLGLTVSPTAVAAPRVAGDVPICETTALLLREATRREAVEDFLTTIATCLNNDLLDFPACLLDALDELNDVIEATDGDDDDEDDD